ncbi:hypothetical protein R1flu_019800 [Riccia fluitans]|uniref:Uncharacterized protein n=1 Tax=Riccia fluitans TaxID=41844 RepID=A0ABD1ZK37_9MARC
MSDFPPEAFLDDDHTESDAGVIPDIPNRSDIESDIAIGEERQLAMSSKMLETRYKIDKWTSVGNFALWSYHMRDKLIAQGQARSLLDETLESMKENEWMDLCSWVSTRSGCILVMIFRCKCWG